MEAQRDAPYPFIAGFVPTDKSFDFVHVFAEQSSMSSEIQTICSSKYVYKKDI